MGRHQTEAAYLKSVLLWLQGNWGEPDPPRFYPLREVEQASRYHSVRRTHAAPNRRDVIVDQPRSRRHEMSQHACGPTSFGQTISVLERRERTISSLITRPTNGLTEARVEAQARGLSHSGDGGRKRRSGFRIARWLQSCCQRFIAVVPGWGKSAGTLMCIGAYGLQIGDLGELGPLDVQLAKPDELALIASGLTIDSAFRGLQSITFQMYESFLLDLIRKSGGRITTKTAAELAANLTVGPMEPVFAQIEPMKEPNLYRQIQQRATESSPFRSLTDRRRRQETIKRLSDLYA
jgi:hypothetical protein